MKFMRIVRLLVINVITFLVLLIIVNWACGIYLRKTAKTRADLPNYTDKAYAKQIFRDYHAIQHQYEPFVGWRMLPYKGPTTTINIDGNRIHTAEQNSHEEKKIVRFFGGSTMWGEGSDDQHTIPAIFNRLRPEYEVYNHGQLAYNSRQELDALITLYSKNVAMDLVIFYDGVNDAAFLCPTEIKDIPGHRLVPMYRDKLYARTSETVRELLIKIFFENILKLIQRNADAAASPALYNCISDPDKAEAIAETMMKNWELAHEIVTSRGGKFIAILQPAAFVGEPQLGHLELDENLQKNFREVYRRLKAKMKERNHPWITDMSEAFNTDSYIYIDFCHVSPNGNEIIAEAVAQIIPAAEEAL